MVCGDQDQRRAQYLCLGPRPSWQPLLHLDLRRCCLRGRRWSRFFVLSGFVMALGYASRAHFSVIDYWRARVARIAPLYFVARAPVVAANLWVGNLDITATVLSATFVHAWVPSFALSLNFVAWSVSVEVLFYASFPALVWLINTRRTMPTGMRPTGTLQTQCTGEGAVV